MVMVTWDEVPGFQVEPVSRATASSEHSTLHFLFANEIFPRILN